MLKKTRSNKRSTPPPQDGSQYILVKTKEGSFWRRKRGSIKPAPVNDVLARNAEASKVTGPAAKRIVDKLRPYLKELRTGRLTVRIIGALRKALNRKENIDFTFLEGMELQPEHPLKNLLLDPYVVEQAGRSLRILIPIEKGRVKQLNNIVTDYYFEAIVVQGDATKDKGLRVDSVESKVYPIGGDQKQCELSIDLPASQGPWMLLLKILSLEGNEMAINPRHYGMKVVKTGP